MTQVPCVIYVVQYVALISSLLPGDPSPGLTMNKNLANPPLRACQ